MSEHINNLTTLCYIEKDDCYLMLHRVKKEQDVNKDKWIGIGGHFEAGESPEECLLREVKEETGLTLTNWRFRGIISFTFHAACSDLRERESQNQMTLQWEKNGKLVKNGAVQADMEYMCLYTADGFEGEMTECEEGNLEWIPKSEIYNLPIWEGDKLFFQLLDREVPFFSLKLDYIGEDLIRAVLDGKELVL